MIHEYEDGEEILIDNGGPDLYGYSERCFAVQLYVRKPGTVTVCDGCLTGDEHAGLNEDDGSSTP